MNAETTLNPPKKRGRRRIMYFTVHDAESGAPAAFNRTAGAFLKVANGVGDVFWPNKTRSGRVERTDSVRRRIEKLMGLTYHATLICPDSKRFCHRCIIRAHKAGEGTAT